jgi:hypothetical protein
MNVQYEGRRLSDDGTCIVTRRDIGRVPDIIRRALPREEARSIIELDLKSEFPSSPPFGWGSLGRESAALAACMLTNALPDYTIGVVDVFLFAEEILVPLTADRWSMEWGDIWRWWVATQESIKEHGVRIDIKPKGVQ